MKKATANGFGDLVCPYCGTNIITPLGMEVLPGVGTCPMCVVRERTERDFEVDQETADLANRRAIKEEDITQIVGALLEGEYV